MNMPRIIIAFFLICSSVLLGQEPHRGTATVMQLLSEEKYGQAEATLQAKVLHYKTNGNLDSLATLPYYIGKVQQHLSNATEAARRAEQLIAELESLNATPRNLYEASMSLVYFLDEIGEVQWSYNTTLKAWEHAQKADDTTPEETGHLAYNLGAGALQLGNFDLASNHFKEALHRYTAYPETSPQKVADAYNAMGAVMWFSTNLDSAQFYYGKSLETVAQMEVDELQKKYLTAITLANMALIQQAQGRTSQAIQTLQQTLANYHEVILHTDDESQRHKTTRFQWKSMANLASFHNDMGDYKTANDLLEYVYKSQQQKLEAQDPELYKTRIKVGQSLMSMKEYAKAKNMLTQAIETMAGSGGEDLYWKGVALFGLAETTEQLGEIQDATEYYKASETAFKKAQKTDYNKDYLHFLRKKALFHAQHSQVQLAEDTALDGYEYVARTSGKDNTLVFKHLYNLSEVYFHLGNYEKALHYGEQSIQQLEKQGALGSLQDSVQAHLQKPMAMLFHAKSTYHLGDRQDTAFLKGLYDNLQDALGILERQRTFLTSAENIRVLMHNNQAVFDFVKHIGLELYRNTGDPTYLNDVIGFHESSLYHKIRLRFNLRNSSFIHVPETVLQKESQLKNQLNDVFKDGYAQNNTEQMALFFEVTTAWDAFLSDLQKSYPRYYKMRYGTIVQSIGDITAQMDDDLTMVRYFFVDEALYASILTNTSMELIPLDYPSIKHLLVQPVQTRRQATALHNFHKLYQHLWAPFAGHIHTKNVTIIPDRELFNLNFETLLTQQATTPEAFATHSLLNKHIISYHFSLLMLSQEHSKPFDRDYTAFAPGFFDRMKADFQKTAHEALTTDNTYLTLLAQPFTVDLVKSLNKRYHGKLFLEDRATATNFKEHIRGAKILHIGTHAESNNVSPDFSRIIFAKDAGIKGLETDNSLYAHELYGYDLSSNLTVLAACETGKPEYQAGEGMVSLAHAFSYAGSQSLLTALWQVDEEISARILEHFYNYLSRGLSKSEALQRAKLDYLQHAEGRAALPQYWAGLVLIGDTAPIALEQQTSYRLWTAVAGILTLLIVWFTVWRYRKASRQ